MIDLSKGISYEKYFEEASEEQKAKIKASYDNIKFSSNSLNILKNLKNTINIAAFSEHFCPDCTATLPFMKKMQEINSNIKLYIFGVDGNEETIKSYTGEVKIPTVIFFTEGMKLLGVYNERPKVLNEKMKNADNDLKLKLINDYRNGKYNNLIEDEIIGMIE
ncbi:MAG TPA: hypothetical protein DEF85_10810 [Clostridiaceae bacterium]|jgi:hypothetical protein|nr:hypothetical protein [Clostridiaceae bacterium]HBF77780.1 hypothetical protein [Clostridiaceae bacterium]HBG39111.1 hypothetical protein [Clostridiaceae bacterium]HBN28954.1 hypothetical protein [Clostridiaceae bacterium]HBX49365.1 hypothetical protein [Clostridiaceae bacterium]